MRKILYWIIHGVQFAFFLLSKIYFLRYVQKQQNILHYLPDGTERLPKELKKILSRGVRNNAKFPAGKCIRIRTNAKSLDMTVVFRKRSIFPHMSNTATSGIDIYTKYGNNYCWKQCIAPNTDIQMMISAHINLGDEHHAVFIYLPAFAQVDSLFIKKQNGILYEHINTYGKRIIVYGSSVTQGCAASRPSLSYANYISRILDCDVMNFGFSEAARGEETLTEYLAGLHADAYIIEYDHNVTVEELRLTHLRVYAKIREANPNSLIVLMARFSGGLSITLEEEQSRREIISGTYKQALAKGDRRIALIDGRYALNMTIDDLFADDRHPNDYGMKIIADTICNVIAERGI